jgi:DNA gyrase/topoisomerase IV subunit A
MMGILDGRPVLLTLPVMLHTHVEHRESVIERRAKFDLEKAESRAHILEGLVKAQDRIDDIIAVGKASESREQFELILKGEESIIKVLKRLISPQHRRRQLLKEDYINLVNLMLTK